MSRVTKLRKKYRGTKNGSERWLEGHQKQLRDSRRQRRDKYNMSHAHQAVSFLYKMTETMHVVIAGYFAKKEGKASTS